MTEWTLWGHDFGTWLALAVAALLVLALLRYVLLERRG